MNSDFPTTPEGLPADDAPEQNAPTEGVTPSDATADKPARKPRAPRAPRAASGGYLRQGRRGKAQDQAQDEVLGAVADENHSAPVNDRQAEPVDTPNWQAEDETAQWDAALGAEPVQPGEQQPGQESGTGAGKSERRGKQGKRGRNQQAEGAPERINRGKLIPISDEPVEGLAFDDVIAGALDAEDAPDAPGFPKRVLPPQPELPKLHKVLAQSGLGSRLEMEKLITEGRISVNNQPAHIGQRIQWGDKVRVNGKLLRLNIAPPRPRVLAYHKPVGEVVTHDDPQNRPTVFRKLPRLQQGKWQSVGRLDLNTEGLLLFTNSGELANRMMHPRFGLQREYAVRVLGALSNEEKERLLAGIQLDDGVAQFGSIDEGGGEGANHWYKVTINEGRNREVRRMFEALGHAVSRLIRIRYGAMQLPRGLRRGFYMELGDRDIRALTAAAGMDMEAPIARGPQRDARSQQAKARGLRRAAPRPDQGQHEDAGYPADEMDTDNEDAFDSADVQASDDGNQAPRQRPAVRNAGLNAEQNGNGSRLRRGRFGRLRNGGANPPGEAGAAHGMPSDDDFQPQDMRGDEDWSDDDFSQKGVSHESPFEKKNSRKRIFNSANEVPSIVKAQRAGAPRSGGSGRGGAGRGATGGGQGGQGGGRGRSQGNKAAGGQAGGIDPMKTSFGFIGADSYAQRRGPGSANRGPGRSSGAGGRGGANRGGGAGGGNRGGGRGGARRG